MTLTDIIHGVGEVTATAMGAQSYDFGAPTQKPATLPWVAVVDGASTTEAKTYSYRDPTDGRLKARGKLRKHTGMAYVLLSTSGDIANEDAMMAAAKQDVLDAFDDDQELLGVGSDKRCDKVWIASVEKYRAEWEGITYAGIHFEWNVIEL